MSPGAKLQITLLHIKGEPADINVTRALQNACGQKSVTIKHVQGAFHYPYLCLIVSKFRLQKFCMTQLWGNQTSIGNGKCCHE